jgi:CHAD domain-containing protein
VIDRHRQYAHAEAEATINSSRYARSVRKVMYWFDKTGWRSHATDELLGRPIGELAPMVLERLARSVKKRGGHFADQSEEQRHQLRIALKKMRYTAELLSDLYDQAASKQFIQRIKRLQDDLGYRHDVSAAREAIASLTGTSPPDLDLVRAGQRILGWHKRRLDGDEADLRRHLRQYLATEPFWVVSAKSWSDKTDCSLIDGISK